MAKKRSKKKVKQFLNIYEESKQDRGRRIDGRLHVRCVRASELEAGDHHLFRKGTADPFCVVVFRDEDGFYSRRRTRTIERNRDPAWRQQFTFGVREGTKSITLDFDVWDEDVGETDDFLGSASLDVKLTNLCKAHQWQEHSLTLREDKKKGKIKPTNPMGTLGYLEVMVYWEPWSQASWWRAWQTVVPSPKAIATFASIILIVVHAIVIVAGSARWLCLGDELRTCQAVEVTGAAVSAVKAGHLIFFCALIQFSGAMGMLGKDWTFSPPHLHDMLEDIEADDIEDLRKKEEQLDMVSMSEPSMDLHIMAAKGGPSLIDYKIFLGLRNMRQWSFKTVRLTLRYIAFMCHLLPILLLMINLLWSCLQQGDGMIFGEGAYLAMIAVVLLILSELMFIETKSLQMEAPWQRRSAWIKNVNSTIEAMREGQRLEIGELRWLVGQVGQQAQERVLEPLKQKVMGKEDPSSSRRDEESSWPSTMLPKRLTSRTAGRDDEDDDDDDDDEEEQSRAPLFCGGCALGKKAPRSP